MANKPVTIRDVAGELGVSYTTVSRAISGSAGVGEETRQKILETCERMGYTTNYMARALAGKKTRLLGLLLGTINNPYMSLIAAIVEKQARSKGYHLLLSNSMNNLEQEMECFTLLIGRQVDGIILVPALSTSFSKLEKYISQIPTLFLGDNLRDSRVSYVAVDNYQGAHIGCSHLISLGHRNILYLGRRPGSTTHKLRGEGYRDACQEADITPQFMDNTVSPSSSIEDGYRLGLSLFSKPFKYTAIFAAADSIALGVMRAADESRVTIPGDISLLGFDNISYSNLPRINLTTVSQPIETMAKTAVDLLIEKIENPSTGYAHRVLSPALIERSTCSSIIDPATVGGRKK